MALTAVEFGVRGAVVALFMVVCALLLRHATVHRAAHLGAAISAAGAAYAISTAPLFSNLSFGWSSPFIALAVGRCSHRSFGRASETTRRWKR